MVEKVKDLVSQFKNGSIDYATFWKELDATTKAAKNKKKHKRRKLLAA